MGRQDRRAVGRAAAWVRMLAVVAVGAGLLGAAPSAARAADGLDGDSYTSEEFGWSVAFDDRVWEAEENESDRDASLQYIGVSLSADGAFANLLVYDDGIDDAGDCLDDLDRSYSASDGWDDLGPARRLDPPATDRDAEAALYAGTLLLDDDEIDAVLYLECREVEGATLAIVITVVEADYADLLPDIEELLAGVETGGSIAAPDDDETTTTDDRGSGADGLEGGTYTDADHGWSVTFDEGDWEAEATESEPDADLASRGVTLTGDGMFAYLVVYDDGIEDAAECLEDLDLIYTSGATGWEDVEPADDLDIPETANDAEGVLYTGISTIDDDLDGVLYLECRAVDGGTLSMDVTIDAARYDDLLPVLEDLLAGIETGGGPARDDADADTDTDTDGDDDGDDDDETPAADDEPTDLGETDLDAGVFVGEAFPVRAEWDPDGWESVEEIAEEGREGVELFTPGSAAVQIFTQDTTPNYGADECLDDNVDGWRGEAPDLEDFTPPDGAELDWPRGAEAAQSTGTADIGGDDVTLVFSASCLELGDGEDYLIVTFTSYASEYEDNAPIVNDILTSIEVEVTDAG